MSFEFVVSGNTNASKPPENKSQLFKFDPGVPLCFCLNCVSMFLRCCWGQHLLSACWQWSVWSKLHQGALWMVDPSANTAAIVVRWGFPSLSSFLAQTFFFFFSSGPLAALRLGSVCWQIGGEGRVCGTVRQRCGPPLCWACWTPDPVPSQAAPVSSSNRVHYGSAPQTHRADTKLTQQLRVNRSLFALGQNHLLLNFLRQQMWPGGHVAPTAMGFFLQLLSCLNFMLT